MTWGRMQNPMRGLLHGSAALFSVVGLTVLMSRVDADSFTRPGVIIFGLALIAMFTVSALYHSVPWTKRWKRRMQRIDHTLIFLVVAATFTPLALAALEGLALLIGMLIVWGIAAVGILLKFVLSHPRTGLSISLQMAMGWSALAFLPWFASRLGWGIVVLILAGGVCYTIGTIVFATKRPRLAPRVFGYHELFHVLVMAGAAFHYSAIVSVA